MVLHVIGVDPCDSFPQMYVCVHMRILFVRSVFFHRRCCCCCCCWCCCFCFCCVFAVRILCGGCGLPWCVRCCMFTLASHIWLRMNLPFWLWMRWLFRRLYHLVLCVTKWIVKLSLAFPTPGLKQVWLRLTQFVKMAQTSLNWSKPVSKSRSTHFSSELSLGTWSDTYWIICT